MFFRLFLFSVEAYNPNAFGAHCSGHSLELPQVGSTLTSPGPVSAARGTIYFHDPHTHPSACVPTHDINGPF